MIFNIFSHFNKNGGSTSFGYTALTRFSIRRVVGGGSTPVSPLDMHPLGPPLEPEAGSNLLNSKLTYIFRFFTFLINRQCHNLSIL